MNGLKRRGVKGISLSAVEGLAGSPDFIAAVSPGTGARLCITRMICNPARFVPYKNRKAVTGI